ncbi:hypothetical protein [uncultured Methylibium sp.]|uniref:hypothetical protein n=1 Tax=uncultured Methylibium sp. TaxID=381093 RepID=UPI0025FAA939|nr:hypothetical protein [uncultured Methylibium sp.]
MKNLRSLLFTVPGLGVAAVARAHEGHGQEGLHWHAFDAWGWVALAVAAAAALWFARRK